MNDLKQQAFTLLNAWTTGEVSPLANVLSPQFQEIDHPQATAHGLEGLREKVALFHRAHGRVALTACRQIALADQVCTRWTLTADLRNIEDPETRKPQSVLIQGITWTYFADGQIVRNVVHRDIVGELMQKGYLWEPVSGSHMVDPPDGMAVATIESPSSAGDMLQRMLDASDSAVRFRDFLSTHLAQDVQGQVGPHQALDKAETIRRLIEIFAMASGGQISVLAAADEGRVACVSVLLTGNKHDLPYTQWLDPKTEIIVEASIWLALNDSGQIAQLDLLGDMLSPGMAKGMKMVKAPKLDAIAAA